MKITVLVENTTCNPELQAMHGLSLFVEAEGRRILIDTGNGTLFLENAKKLGVDLSKVDMCIITHGHSDHGGGLKHFLEINNTAKVYIQRSAFDKYYTKAIGFLKVFIGLEECLKVHPQVVLLDGDFLPGEKIKLITNPAGSRFMPKFNAKLLKRAGRKTESDDFCHEQSVLIEGENKAVLVAGCAHRGIVNIVEDAQKKASNPIGAVISGFHLFNPASGLSEDAEAVAKLGGVLTKSGIKYYTCHCTGEEAFKQLKSIMNDKLDYIATGQTMEL